jgi:hypothetical protein
MEELEDHCKVVCAKVVADRRESVRVCVGGGEGFATPGLADARSNLAKTTFPILT